MIKKHFKGQKITISFDDNDFQMFNNILGSARVDVTPDLIEEA